MQLPFTAEQFFGVFRAYNAAVWPAQVGLLALALLAIVMVAWRNPGTDVVVGGVLAFLWAWLALAYHVAFFARINPLAYAFAAMALVQALLLAWYGVVRRSVAFEAAKDARTGVGWALIVFALAVYPAWAIAAGHAYPELPTFGVPCPATIFTIGMLAFSRGAGARALLAIPILWSAIAGTAAFTLDVMPDLGLVAAGVVGIVLWGSRPGIILAT